MPLKIFSLTILISCLFASPAYSQSSYLQDIDIAMQEAKDQVAITFHGLKPSPCLNIVESPLIEDFMVTVKLEFRFPEGVSSCVRKNAPFSVTSLIEAPQPGEYEVQVTINGEMQILYQHFNIEEEHPAVTL